MRRPGRQPLQAFDHAETEYTSKLHWQSRHCRREERLPAARDREILCIHDRELHLDIVDMKYYVLEAREANRRQVVEDPQQKDRNRKYVVAVAKLRIELKSELRVRGPITRK